MPASRALAAVNALVAVRRRVVRAERALRREIQVAPVAQVGVAAVQQQVVHVHLQVFQCSI